MSTSQVKAEGIEKTQLLKQVLTAVLVLFCRVHDLCHGHQPWRSCVTTAMPPPFHALYTRYKSYRAHGIVQHLIRVGVHTNRTIKAENTCAKSQPTYRTRFRSSKIQSQFFFLFFFLMRYFLHKI